MIRPLMLVPVLAFFGLVGAFGAGMFNGDQPLPSARKGGPAPAVVVTALGGQPLPVDADLKAPGVKLVNFWASWCQPCRAEHPVLEQLKAEGVVIYGVNYKDKPADAEGFLAEMGNPYAKIGADAGRMAIDWGVYGVPETYVIDGNGVVLLRVAGPITAAALADTIRPALAQAAE